ncbi:MAG: inositol monophosphatase family protein [Patescibacteria group bacterium]
MIERTDVTLENPRSIARLLGAVVSAGSSIKELEERAFEIKGDESHRSGITSGDVRAQDILFENIGHAFPEAYILSEEGGVGGGKVLDINNPKGILEMANVVVMDPIDGTAGYANKLGTWSVGAGLMQHGELIGSVLHAPALNGGMTVTAEKGKGVYITEWGAKKPERIEPLHEGTARKDAIVAMGVDATLHQPFMSAVPSIASQIRAWTLANSGLLALAQIATGRLQALIQTPQKPWDWAPMYRAVLESGRVFKFFRLVPDMDANDGTSKLVPAAEYDERSFSVASRENRLGFVAGEPAIAEWLFDQLPKHGWSVRRPDATA